jgi:hypothetical protein
LLVEESRARFELRLATLESTHQNAAANHEIRVIPQ